MTELNHEFWSHVQDYVAGHVDLTNLEEWLAEHVQDIADSLDPGLQEANDLLWTLISEKSYGHRSDTEIKETLQPLLPLGRARQLGVR
jgi:hypothetical protein